MGLSYVEGDTHYYIRHGSTTLISAFDVATGAMIAECWHRYRHLGILSLLRRIDKEDPHKLDVHLIVDNYCTHKHAKGRSWLAQRPRFHVSHTPPYAIWLNQVARWFGIIEVGAFYWTAWAPDIVNPGRVGQGSVSL